MYRKSRKLSPFSKMAENLPGISISPKILWNLACMDMIDCVGFNDTSALVGHFVSSPREREKRDRRDSRRNEREEKGRKRNRNEREETEEIKTFPLYLLQG